jgi:hypothetical protein
VQLQKVPHVVTLLLMPVTGATLIERDENFRQIDRLVSSNVLQGSESLCKLLRYLAEQALEHPGAGVKEYQIATEVFGRPSYFDPRLDSTVRVQTGRLRSKLAEYYGGPGSGDPVVVEIPKGSYTLTFHFRAPVPSAPPLTVQLPEPAPTSPVPASATTERARDGKPGTLLLAMAVLSGILALSVLILSYLLFKKPAPVPVSASQAAEARTLESFWRSFVDQPEDPWVVFSNAEFTGRPETGMRYFNEATDSRDTILDHYTGVGEVIAIHELDRVFTLLNHGLRVKRGRLLSLDDAKNNNLIFVGSPSENLPLREIPTSKEFVFRRTELAARKGDLAIVNAHPANGEQRLYFASSGNPFTEDYAIIALVPGLNQSRWVLVLAGISTLGTQAAVEFVTRPRTVEDLLLKLTGSKSGAVVPFEAVLKVRISQGVPVKGEIVAMHPR